jgi:hypothetical protein
LLVATPPEGDPSVLSVREYKGYQMAGASQAKTSRALVKILKTGTLALSLTVTATVGLAADYEIFDDFMSVATGESRYSVERLDHKNRKLHHCTAILGAETKQLTGQCAERPGFPENPTGKERNLQGGISNVFGGVPVFGSWKIDQTTGKTEFCISDTARCVDVTPQ